MACATHRALDQVNDGTLLVRCLGASRTFTTKTTSTTALRSASCAVRPGQRIAISGPSGSGKSTLLHILAGLDGPTSGTVEWPHLGGRRALRPGPVGVVFQAPSLLAPLDVLENVALVPLLAGQTRSRARALGRAVLRSLDLEDLASRLPEELSGGQAQRVAVARALAGSPKLVLADEPTGQLDQATGALVIDVLLKASDATGAAVVVATHDAAVARRFETQWRMIDGALAVDEGA
jgi:ABC-type lipoprotein export system ATPase subunit